MLLVTSLEWCILLQKLMEWFEELSQGMNELGNIGSPHCETLQLFISGEGSMA